MENKNGQLRMTKQELLDLFKHWDSIEAQKEFLYIPLSFGAIAATAASWDKITPLVVAAMFVGSIGLYIYYLMTIRRFSYIQRNILNEIRKIDSGELNGILALPKEKTAGQSLGITGSSKRVFGVRILRIAQLPVLTAIWDMLLFAKCSGEATNVQKGQAASHFGYFVFGLFFTLFAGLMTYRLLVQLNNADSINSDDVSSQHRTT